jgi:uncharacterized protein YkwD
MQNTATRLLRGAGISALALALILPVGCSNHDAPTGPSTTTNTPAPPSPAPSSGPSDAEVQSLIDLVNDHRRSRGLNPLVWNDEVAAVAQAHSQDMVDRNYRSHINPEGENCGARLTEAGIERNWWGENLCWGFSNASSAFNFWINSDGHRANIERSNFTHHGVGKVNDVWTHVFIEARTTTGVEFSALSSAPSPTSARDRQAAP